MGEHDGGHRTHRLPDRGHAYLWGGDVVEPPLDQQGGGARRDGRRRVGVAVLELAGHAAEEGARRHLTGVEDDVADDGVAPAFGAGHGVEDRRERYRGKQQHRVAAYPRPGARPGSDHGSFWACGGSATGGADGIPSRWIAYWAICLNNGAAATPP